LEKNYQLQHPEAEPLGKFYAVLGLAKLLRIVEEAQGRRIIFAPGLGTGQGLGYSFE
jgi:hypothetical protein